MEQRQNPFRIAVLGTGSVGSAVLRILGIKQKEFERKTGRPIEITAVCSRNLSKLPTSTPVKSYFTNWSDLRQVIEQDPIDTVIELFGGIETPFEVADFCLRKGIPVITANKALLAERGPELAALVRQENTSIAYEASCGGGIPLLQSLKSGLIANRIHAFIGILNGTCNYMLEKMAREGLDYQTVLKQAQSIGLAEVDPRLDVEGIDTLHKLYLMANLSFSRSLPLQKIPVSGIAHVSTEHIRAGQQLNLELKLLAYGAAEGESPGSELSLWVGPAFLAGQNPLAQLRESFNGVLFYGDVVGKIFLSGRGAGESATASAVLADLLLLMRGSRDLSIGAIAESADSPNCWYNKVQDWLLFPSETGAGCFAGILRELNGVKISPAPTDPKVWSVRQTSEKELNKILSILRQKNIFCSYYPVLQFPEEVLLGESQVIPSI